MFFKRKRLECENARLREKVFEMAKRITELHDEEEKQRRLKNYFRDRMQAVSRSSRKKEIELQERIEELERSLERALKGDDERFVKLGELLLGDKIFGEMREICCDLDPYQLLELSIKSKVGKTSVTFQEGNPGEWIFPEKVEFEEE